MGFLLIYKELYASDGQPFPYQEAERLLKCSNSLIVGKDAQYVALQAVDQAEKIAADGIRKLLNSRKPLFTADELNTVQNGLESRLGIPYAPAQKKAFGLLRHTGLAILTGGPGTGKTTTLNGLIQAYTGKYPQGQVVLAAPTGRAAQRMSEMTGRTASTVHKLVEIGGKSRRGKTAIEADLLIIDESSMLDTEMVAWLFSSVTPDTLVLLVGDTDQLPSVGPGDVLRNLINCGKIHVCRLDTVYRQQGESLIVQNAKRINSGIEQLLTDPTFRMIERSQDRELPSEVTTAILAALRENPDQMETQVLCTSHKGDSGIERLNTVLQELLNPKKSGQKCVRFGSTEFRLKDKIITTNNNYSVGYCNGDIGFITGILQDGILVDILGKEILIPSQNLRDLSLAYCISIHKSQGSEFRNAIIVLPGNPAGMLKRNLLYTAVTRAKSTCVIISCKGAVSRCCRTAEHGKRTTQLCERIFS